MKKARYLILLVSLLTLLVVNPFVEGTILGVRLFHILLVLLLLSSVNALLHRKRLLIPVLLLFLSAVAAQASDYLFEGQASTVASAGLYIVFFTLTAAMILWGILTAEEITWDTIFGACSVYLFMGLVWALIYLIMETVHPGTFLDSHAAATETRETAVDALLYYSYVTLSTLGYGDITPDTQAGRTFATLEAIMGQLFVAILVARLVGLHIAHSMRKK